MLEGLLRVLPVSEGSQATQLFNNIKLPRLTGLRLSSLSAWTHKPFCSGSQPKTVEAKQPFAARPLQAQPEKRVTSAESDAGAAP